MTKRKALSQKVRFEVFKRDGFCCQYCGKHPPGVLLQVDHIVAVANDGSNEMDNLVTSCHECNIGKGARPLSSIPQSLDEKAQEIAERERQLQEYSKIISAKNDRLEGETWKILETLRLVENRRADNRKFLSTRRFIDKLGFFEVEEAANIAIAKFYYPTRKRFLYFCGICWKRIREGGYQ